MAKARPLDVTLELVEAFEHSGRLNAYLACVVPARIWRMPPPSGRGRTIAAIFAHIHSVRRTFGNMAVPNLMPPPLDRAIVRPSSTARALARGNDALTRLFRESLARGESRLKGLPRRTVNMIVYLLQHDAHHRGQIFTLARDLGHEFTADDVMRVWGWKALPDPRAKS